MSREVSWDDIPDRLNLEAGYYQFSIQSIKELEPTEKAPNLTYLGTFSVEEPESDIGQVHNERFTIGTDEDPEALEPNTWKRSMGSKNLKQLLVAAGVPRLSNTEATFQAAKGARFVGRIVKTPGKGEREGQEFSNMRGYFSTTSQEALRVGVTGVLPNLPNGGGGGVSVPSKMKCAECSAEVDRSEYGKHLMSHRPPQEESK